MLNNSTKSAPKESLLKMTEASWTIFHPSLQKSFYANLDAPTSTNDAQVKQTCHLHAVDDIGLQIDVVEAELQLEKEQEIPYNQNKMQHLQERRIKLINAKRYHKNASNAYWFFIQG